MDYAFALLDVLHKTSPCVTVSFLEKDFSVCVYTPEEEGILEKYGYSLNELECGYYRDMESSYKFAPSGEKDPCDATLLATVERMNRLHRRKVSESQMETIWKEFQGKELSFYVSALVVSSILGHETPMEDIHEHHVTKKLWVALAFLSAVALVFYRLRGD